MAMKSTLFSDDSDVEDGVPSADDHKLHINKNFAYYYETSRKKEELQKLKDSESQLKTYDSDNENCSDESEDDELAKPTTQALDFLASTLLALKSGKAKEEVLNSRLHSEADISGNEGDNKNGHFVPGDEKKKKGKEVVYNMDIHRRETNWNTAEEGVVSDDEEPRFPEKKSRPGLSLQYCAVDDLLADKETSSTKASQSLSKASKAEHLDKRLEQAFHRPNMTKEDEWLANFFLQQRQQLENPSDSEDELRRHSNKRRQHRTGGGEMHGFVYEDEADETKRTMRETLASFGGEGPSLDQQRPKSYPAVLESTVRIKDDRRRQHRLKVVERKAAEKQRLKQQVQQLQAIKRKEIQERLQKIQEISGQTRLAFSEADLGDEFDPDAHDRKMQEAFGDFYYDDGADNKKPVFEYDGSIDDGMADYDGYEVHAGDDAADQDDEAEFPSSDNLTNNDLHEDDYPEEHDAEAPSAAVGGLERGSSRRRRGKQRRSDQLSLALQRKKPLFDPELHNFDEYFDEYYGLNFEDVIAGGEVKCRFKYKQVEPNNFGLNTEEILMTDEKELNRWCSLKKILNVDRTAEEEQWDRKVYSAKGQNIAYKKKMLPTLFKPHEEEGDTKTIIDAAAAQRAEEDKKKKKNLKKKLRKQRKLEEEINEEENTANDDDVGTSSTDTTISKKSKRKRDSVNSDGIEKEDEEGESAGTSAKKPRHSSTTVLKAKKSKADDLHKFNKKMKRKRCEEEAKLQSEGPVSKEKSLQRKSRKDLVVGDAFSTVLKLSDERLSAYNIAGLSKIKKQARYQEKVAERGQQAGHERRSSKGAEAINGPRKGSSTSWKHSQEKTNKIKNKDKNVKHDKSNFNNNDGRSASKPIQEKVKAKRKKEST